MTLFLLFAGHAWKIFRPASQPENHQMDQFWIWIFSRCRPTHAKAFHENLHYDIYVDTLNKTENDAYFLVIPALFFLRQSSQCCTFFGVFIAKIFYVDITGMGGLYVK